jgi:hypothetical protein
MPPLKTNNPLHIFRTYNNSKTLMNRTPTPIFALAAVMLFTNGCATKVGNASFPESSASFTPKSSYAVSKDKLWDATLSALDKNRIATASVDKASGVIQTDYIEGESALIGFGLIASQHTRYKYNVTLRDQSEGAVKLNVICKIESTMKGTSGSSQWHDVTSQNAEQTKKLENWLYQEVEKGL